MMVVVVPEVALVNVNVAVGVPVMAAVVVIVVVVLTGSVIVDVTVAAIAKNVLAPVTERVPAPSLDRVQLKVEPPPTKVLPGAAVMLILPVPVPAVVVYAVGAALLKAVAVPAGQTKNPLLNVRFFVPAAVAYDVPTVRVLPFRSMVPLAWVNARAVPIVKAS